jgi:hypothetical protein
MISYCWHHTSYMNTSTHFHILVILLTIDMGGSTSYTIFISTLKLRFSTYKLLASSNNTCQPYTIIFILQSLMCEENIAELLLFSYQTWCRSKMLASMSGDSVSTQNKSSSLRITHVLAPTSEMFRMLCDIPQITFYSSSLNLVSNSMLYHLSILWQPPLYWRCWKYMYIMYFDSAYLFIKLHTEWLMLKATIRTKKEMTTYWHHITMHKMTFSVCISILSVYQAFC